MKKEKERLVSAIVTFLENDQLSDTRWHDPSPKNTDRVFRVKKDAERIADIAERILIKKL